MRVDERRNSWNFAAIAMKARTAVLGPPWWGHRGGEGEEEPAYSDPGSDCTPREGEGGRLRRHYGSRDEQQVYEKWATMNMRP